MTERKTYKPKKFNLSGLQGISDKTLQTHFKLYEGYVKGVNELNERIADVLKDGKVDQEEFPAYSELNRRLGFEYNGMVLHEYYFENLKRGGAGVLAAESRFKRATEMSFGSFDIWKLDFQSLDLFARDWKCFGLRPDPCNGCVGTCIHPGLCAIRPSQVYRRVLFQRQLGGCGRATANGTHFAHGSRLVPVKALSF